MPRPNPMRRSEEQRVAPGSETLRALFSDAPALTLLDELAIGLPAQGRPARQPARPVDGVPHVTCSRRSSRHRTRPSSTRSPSARTAAPSAPNRPNRSSPTTPPGRDCRRGRPPGYGGAVPERATRCTRNVIETLTGNRPRTRPTRPSTGRHRGHGTRSGRLLARHGHAPSAPAPRAPALRVLLSDPSPSHQLPRARRAKDSHWTLRPGGTPRITMVKKTAQLSGKPPSPEGPTQ